MAFTPSPYQIAGKLSFGSAGSTYQSAYANALRLNSTNYSNILKGYQGLTSSVLGNIKGMGESAQQDITDQYAMLGGQQAQQLVSRGLGNTTVAQSVQRGLGYDQAKARTGASNQFANTYAGYQSNLGQSQLNWMNSVNAPYPNPQNYIQPQYPEIPNRPLNQQQGGGGGSFGGGNGNWMIPQNPSGGGSGGAYSYVPPAHGKGQDINVNDPEAMAWWLEGGEPDPYTSGSLPGFNYSGGQGGSLPGFDYSGYGGDSSPSFTLY